MFVLYIIEALFVLGYVALVIGVLYKIATYPRKQVTAPDGVTRWVDDEDYHYRPEELWEAPEQNWQKNETLPTVVDHGVEVNHYGDDDWHNEQHH